MEKRKCRSDIGGQAVIEGVMMRGHSSMATAVRDEKGNIQVESTRFVPAKERGKFRRAPFIRGIFNLGTSMASGVGTLMRASEVFEGEAEPSKFEKWCSEKLHIDIFKAVMYVAVVVGVLLAIGLFIVLPWAIMLGIRELFALGDIILPQYVDPLVEGVLRVVIFIIYILLTALMKDIKRVYMYHGAEHKTISCYEYGLELTVENVQKQSTIHDRCGTTFMFLVMVISIIVFSLASLIPIKTGIKGVDMLTSLLLKLAFIPVVAGISYEILKFLAKYDNKFVSIIKAPGLLLQKVTTKQPTDDMVEVAITAFNTVLAMDADPSIPTTKFNTKVKMDKAIAELDGILGKSEGNADRDWIMCEVLGIKRSELADKSYIWSLDMDRMIEMAKRRAAGEPLQQIFGYTDFYGLAIKVTDKVLCPRPETEYLVEACNELIRDNGYNSVLDMCTGSGAIALAIKDMNKGVQVTGVDISAEALDVARENAEKCNLSVDFVEGNLFAEIDGKYDLIVSNPPYIKSGVIPTLDVEVREHEPIIALDGGEDGLDFYRRIVDRAVEHLTRGGALALEIGFDQKNEVISLLTESGKYVGIECRPDLEGRDRIIIARLK